MPTGVDLSAYRVVQEALTNTLRHAEATRADVSLRYSDGELDVDVRDDGAGTGNGGGSGRGLIGMRERVTAFGGSLETGPAEHRRLPRIGEIPAVTRVLVVDDQPLVRSGFRMVLEERADLELVGEAADGVEALELARELDPDVILMDVRMPNLDGVEATRQLVESGTRARILVLTTFDLDEYVYAAIRAGASGFLLKDVEPAELVDAIRVVAAGNSLFGPAATERLVARFAQQPSPDAGRTLDELTDREKEILTLLASGLSNAELAEKLFLSETTVKTHVSAILRKLRVRDRVQAVIAAYDAGLVSPR